MQPLGLKPRRLALALCVALPLLGTQARAEDFFQVRYFYPPLGPEGWQLEGQYTWRTPGLSFGVRIQELSTFKQSGSLSVNSGPWFAYGSVARSQERQNATYTALLGYSAPQPGVFSDATLTYVHADDDRPKQGYALDSVNVDLRGRLSAQWKWSAGGQYEWLQLQATPDKLNVTRGLNFGVEGKWGEADLRAKTRFTQKEEQGAGAAADPWGWNAALDAAYPLSQFERLNGNLTLSGGGQAGSLQDSETLTMSSTRLKPLTVNASLTRNSGIYGLGVGGQYVFSEALSAGAGYSLSFTTPLSQAGTLSLEYRADPWTVNAALNADLTPDVNGLPSFSVAPTLALSYSTPDLSAALRGNARYAPALAPPLTYHLDATLATKAGGVGAVNWVFGAALDSPTNTRPLSAEVSLQALYRVSERLSLNASARYRTGLTYQGFQAGLGVRYVIK